MSDSRIAGGSCALLVVSCDGYSDLWAPFFTLLRRHWPDCPFPVYLGSGRLDGGQVGVTTLFSEGGRDWSCCVRDYLGQLPHEHVLLMLDDFFLRRTVPTVKVLECLESAIAHNATMVRLIPRPGPTDRLSSTTLIGECAIGLPYRVSTQAAIWNRSKLRELLCLGESIWEFEHNSNQRISIYPHGFYAVWRPVLPYQGTFAHHVLEKGKWLPHEKRIFGRQNIGCDFAVRITLPYHQVLIYHFVQTLDRALDVLPWRTKASLKQRIKYLLAPILRKHFDRLAGR